MNQKKKRGKRLTSTLMAVLMGVSTTVTSGNTIASEANTSSAAESMMEETTEMQAEGNKETEVETEMETTIEMETETNAEEEIEKETKAETTTETEVEIETTVETTENEIETAMETETKNEVETELETRVSPFECLDLSSGLSESELAEIDFSSKRLFVAAKEAVIIDPEHVLSSYADVYLLQYETEAQAKYAYSYYYGRSEFVDVDTVISIADGNNSANAAVPMAAEENPIAQLQEAVAENPQKASGAVAVIDTGINDAANVIESVSMIGDNTADENGHGTKMAQLIAEQNPNASILSIKALGADGTGDVSAVYAAIQYAIDKQVSVINLSVSALGTAENAALTAIIDAATNAGIAVVGAAGNNGHDARFYVPGNIESAYIVGAADENGVKLASSNYGSTVDFNVVADSTSEAAAKFSGYYTLNGAIADEKLVFPTDYKKSTVGIDYNGPILRHQISYYHYQGSEEDLVWISQKDVKTVLDDDYITTYIGFAEDSKRISRLEVYVDFMSMASEHAITDDCIIDLETMTVKIPASYKDAALTIRWFMPDASYSYGYDVDATYMISDIPEKFKVAYDATNGEAVSLEIAQQYVNGVNVKGFTHTADSMNHSYVGYSTDGINAGDYFTIQDGYIAGIQEYPGLTTTRAEVFGMFGPNALNNAEGLPSELVFLTHFSKVTRDADGADVSSWFDTVGGKADGIIRVDLDNFFDGQFYGTEEASAGLGWVFGTCANNTIGGNTPFFQPGGKIICTSKDADGTAYFFYYCKSIRAQWSGGSFSITPVVPKTGFLQIHKASSNPEITKENSCYKFDPIEYSVFDSEDCTHEVKKLHLDRNGDSDVIELEEGTYYLKETTTMGSGYYLDERVYPVTITADTTINSPVVAEVVDTPLNDPLGIQINKINGDGTTVADLSGAEYTITYYPKQYNSIEEIQADSEAKPTVWVIQTVKSDSGYFASLDEKHIVSGSAGPIFGKTSTGTYIIPLGTITIEETKAPTGFTIEGATVSSAKTGAALSKTGNVYLFQFVDENSSVYLKSGNALFTAVDDAAAVTLTCAEVQNKAGIRIEKRDASTKGAASGDADLSGIKFAIVNHTGSAIVNYAGQTIENGEVVQVITTDSQGYAATDVRDLPVGSYLVRELRQDATFDGKNFSEGTSALANASYQWQDNQDVVTITDSDAGQLVWAKTFYNMPVTGIPVMEKHDFELNKKAAMGGVSFEGITFEIYNESNEPVVVNGVSYAKGEVVATAVSDAKGTITTTVAFPIGHYVMKEKHANRQYTMTEETHSFHVVSQNNTATIQYEEGKNAIIFCDRVVRGDLSFIKKNAETDEPLAYIPFKITNNATGETHYIVTDENGKFTSETKKTVNTNANDGILSQYGEKDVIPQKVMDSLVKDAGLWFGMGSEKSMTDANDLYGAFVYGTYTITELKTETTKSMKMYTNTVTIDTDGTLLDLGIVANIPMSIQTTLLSENGTHFTQATKSVTLVDHVAYKNLDTDKTYTLTGTLYVKDGDDLKKLLTKTVDFQPTKISSIQDVAFTFDASKLKGKSVVAFEELSLNGEFCAEHKDKNDENQTVTFPYIQTTACANATKDHVVGANETVTITDQVELKALKLGAEYTLSGTLMNAKTGKPIVVNGTAITARKTFTADEKEMIIPLTYELNASELAGTTTVVFENLYSDGILLASHADLKDAVQTVYIPQIHTTAKDKTTQMNHTKADKKATIIDTVSYTNLLPGKEYTITGTLMDPGTGKAVLIDGERITASTTFTPVEPEGSVDVVFDFDASANVPTTVVVFEDLTYKKIPIAVHADIEDENQTVFLPKIRTNAISGDTKNHVVEAKKEITIMDTVSYEGLEIGREYIVKGVLMDKKTKMALKVDGKEVTAEATFTAKTTNGTVDVTFVFNGENLADTVFVVYEKLFTDGKEVATHTDIEDEDQTVYIPQIRTHAQDAVTSIELAEALPKITIVDIVSYSSLLPKKEYTVTGTLMNKETGEPILIDGEPITANATFVAEKPEGSIEVVFECDASIAGTTVVVFESMEYNKIEVAVHADIEDEEQTVPIPKIHTTATDKVTGDHDGVVAENTTVLDEVFYTNLIPDREYIVKGTLMVKETGEPLTVDEKKVTAEKTFVAEKQDGSVILEFTFNSLALAGKHVVAFENLEYEGILIGTHADLEDEDQTISYPSIHTMAVDQASNSKTMVLGSNVTLADTVMYTGLTAGKSYVMKGIIMDKASGQPIGVSAETVFVAEEADGSTMVTFTFDTARLEGKTVVVFETLYDMQGNQIAAHSDLHDENQTVDIPVHPEKPQIPPVVTGDNSTPFLYVLGLTVALFATAAIAGILIRRRKQA